MAYKHNGSYGELTSGISRRSLLAGFGAAALSPIVTPALAQPAARPKGAPAAPKGQAIMGFSQEVTVLHPLMASNEVDDGLWFNLFSPLWSIDEKGALFPVLAKEVPSQANGGISADGLNWKVNLRDDVTWHDGKPFTAEDVRFTLELIQNPQLRVRSRAGFTLIDKITVDGNTVSWTMKEPFAPLVSFFAWTFMLPKHHLDGAADVNNTPFHSAPVGTGPFKFVERKTGTHVILEANKNYFGEGPYLERLVFRFIPDLNAMYTQFRTGEIDYVGLLGLPPNHATEAKSLKGRKIEVCPRGAIENITLNLEHPALKDKAVRQALYLAMDKQSIIEALYYGLPTPAISFMPQQSWAYNDKIPPHSFDIKKAAAILDAAGWKPGPDGIRSKDGVRLAFSNSTTTGNPVREQAQQLLAQDWAKIGAEMTIKNMPAAVLWAKYFSESQFDSLMTGTTYTTAADPDVTPRFNSRQIPLKYKTGTNVSQLVNPEVDDLLSRAVKTMDQEQRAPLYREAQAKIMGELPMLPIFQYAQVEGVKAGLTGFVNNVNVRSNAWNASTWYWA